MGLNCSFMWEDSGTILQLVPTVCSQPNQKMEVRKFSYRINPLVLVLFLPFKNPYSICGLSSSVFSSVLQNAENGYASEGSSREYQTDSSPGPSTGKQREYNHLYKGA